MSSDARTIRQTVIDAIREAAPATWAIRDDLRPIETIDKPAVQVDYRTIEPLPSAAPGHVRCSFEIRIADHHEDDMNSDPAVDDEVVELITIIDGHRWMAWSDATKGRISDTPYLGWVIQVSALASRTPDRDPDETPDP